MKTKLLIITFLYLSITVQSQSLLDGLQAYYKFDKNSKDITGNGNDLSQVSSNIIYDSIYENDYEAKFKHSNSLVKHNFNTNNYDAYSFALWIKTSNIKGHNQTIIQGASIGFGLHIEANTGKIGGFFNGTSVNSYSSNIVVTDNEWHHIVFQCDGNNLYLYIDGIFDGSMPSVALVGNNSLYIGNSNLKNKGYDGTINELRIYNRLLTKCEITELHRQMTATLNAREGIIVNADDLTVNDYACFSALPKHQPKIKAYPNPVVSNILFLELEHFEEAEFITITNASGQVLIKVVPDNMSKFELNINDLDTGFYYITAHKENIIETIRIFKP